MSEAALTVDASVLAKLFMEEADSRRAEALLDERRAAFAPELIMVEVASAIVRRFRVGGCSRTDAEDSLERANVFFAEGGISLLRDGDLLPRAQSIALDLMHPPKDCLYIAVAERMGGELVTADATLVARAAPQFPFVKPL